jgi:hypothetical protein
VERGELMRVARGVYQLPEYANDFDLDDEMFNEQLRCTALVP